MHQQSSYRLIGAELRELSPRAFTPSIPVIFPTAANGPKTTVFQGSAGSLVIVVREHHQPTGRMCLAPHPRTPPPCVDRIKPGELCQVFKQCPTFETGVIVQEAKLANGDRWTKHQTEAGISKNVGFRDSLRTWFWRPKESRRPGEECYFPPTRQITLEMCKLLVGSVP